MHHFEGIQIEILKRKARIQQGTCRGSLFEMMIWRSEATCHSYWMFSMRLKALLTTFQLSRSRNQVALAKHTQGNHSKADSVLEKKTETK